MGLNISFKGAFRLVWQAAICAGALVVIIIHTIFAMGRRHITLCCLSPSTTHSAAVTINIFIMLDVKGETLHAAVTPVARQTFIPLQCCADYWYFLQLDFN